MEEIEILIAQATAFDSDMAQRHEAFGEIVKRFQDMAFGCPEIVEALIKAGADLNRRYTVEIDAEMLELTTLGYTLKLAAFVGAHRAEAKPHVVPNEPYQTIIAILRKHGAPA